jgi:hypothetical protein
MKLTIEIDDLKNERACIEAVERLYEALVEHQGGAVGAEYILSYAKYGHGYSPEAISRRKFANACGRLPDDDLRLVLEYYAMSKPSKRGLAVELAKRNASLPKEQHYYRGSQDSETMLTQIKRVFRDHKDDCAVIGEGSPASRHEELRRVTEACALFRKSDVYRQIVQRHRRRLRRGDIS